MSKLKQNQSLRQSLSPQQVIQANILQLNVSYLEEKILDELENNPLLEQTESEEITLLDNKQTDEDLVKPLMAKLKKRCPAIYLATKVLELQPREECIHVSFEGPEAPKSSDFDAVLTAIGRSPDLSDLDLSNAGIASDSNGFIPVDQQQRTNVQNIFA